MPLLMVSSFGCSAVGCARRLLHLLVAKELRRLVGSRPAMHVLLLERHPRIERRDFDANLCPCAGCETGGAHRTDLTEPPAVLVVSQQRHQVRTQHVASRRQALVLDDLHVQIVHRDPPHVTRRWFENLGEDAVLAHLIRRVSRPWPWRASTSTRSAVCETHPAPAAS